MAEYIDKQKLIDILEARADMAIPDYKPVLLNIAKLVQLLPAAEVEPVTFTKFNHCRGKLVCGNCGWTFAWSEPKMPYRCPFCGARMDGGAENGK